MSFCSSDLIDNIGVPHLLTEDDEYKGYRIPAGTTVIANQWYDFYTFPVVHTFTKKNDKGHAS